ncbi:MAG: agmatine deiminase [Oscillospiraceae bacterium]|nr:agmatine deiminase [Candidatus Limimonas coprohippi]
MAKRIYGTTPRQDGFRMPGEFEKQEEIFMIWPERQDNWRAGAKPAQKAYADVAEAISRYTRVTMLVSASQYENARARLSPSIRVVEMSSDDAWVRDCGPTFVVNDITGEVRGIDWEFNAWGGLVDGLYFPWDKDNAVARKVCELLDVDSYKTQDFILEGGSIHVDGQGTLLSTKMCLLNENSGRNFPSLSKPQIEDMLMEYLSVDKIIWIDDGIDPNETNGHIDDVACFVRPGEVACIYTDDPNHPFYDQAQAAYKTLCNSYDARGRKLKVHKLCLTKSPCHLHGAETIDFSEETLPRANGEVSIASYMNFLITNGAIILPQFGDENDELAMRQAAEIFPGYDIVGVRTEEIAYGGGNIHCITQQLPKRRNKNGKFL